MKKNNRSGLAYFGLGILTLFVCWLFVGRQGIFGAKVDWLGQHSVFPEYFRQLFYETGDFFPEFAGNIGGGQNIYNFSYYGLYNPIVLFAYLLPFVKMSDYLMAACIAGLLASVWILYYWLGKRGFSPEIRFPVAALFLLAGPMIYHSFHQIMFVNYMPFLLLSLLGVDRHFEKGRSGLYTVSVFLMIMTSFYFSIGGMLVLVLYGLSRWLELREKQEMFQQRRVGNIRLFLRDGLGFLFPMLTAVLMSGVLLIPTAYAILGRSGGGQKKDIWSLFIPDFSVTRLTYSSYGIGLTTLVITVLLTGLAYRKWREKILGIGCILIFSVPVFAWLLNGGLYVRSKALIPFLPLLCYMTAIWVEKQKQREISFRVSVAAYVFTILILLQKNCGGQEFELGTWGQGLLLADGVLMLVCFLLYRRRGRLAWLTVPPILCLFVAFSVFYSHSSDVVDRETYARVTDLRIGDTISRTLDEETGFYRLEQSGNVTEKEADLNRIWDSRQWISSVYSSSYNADYQEFRQNVFEVEEPFRNDLMQAASDNPLYQKLMGVKYIADGTNVYTNENAAPVIYATDKVISEKYYDSLDFPYNQIALMQYAVVQNSRDSGEEWKKELEEKAGLKEISLPEDLAEWNTAGLSVGQKEDGSYHVQAEKKTGVTWQITKEAPQQEQLLYVQFQVKNRKPARDVAVWLNGTRNKLSAGGHIYYNGNTTFTWAIPIEKGQTDVELVFGEGDYQISNLKCYLGDAGILEDEKTAGKQLYQSEFQPNREQTKGDRIQGTIRVENTGYCITSIPYDSGFEIFVDGKRTVGEKVNTTFLGFPVAAGAHDIEIRYHVPGVELGKLLSCIGAVMFGIALLRNKIVKSRL